MPTVPGLYRATVVDATDPLGQRRLKVVIPLVSGTDEVWALACVPAGNRTMPFINDTVWVAFEAGDAASPVWLGVLQYLDVQQDEPDPL